jgi:hypothetical protein
MEMALALMTTDHAGSQEPAWSFLMLNCMGRSKKPLFNLFSVNGERFVG